MKKIITISVMVLLCHLASVGQICEIDLGEDQRTCEFQDTLIGVPIGGSWNYLCEDSTAIVSFQILNDSSTLVTFSQCGSYTFEYRITDSTCTVSDTLQIDFENPAIVNYTVDVGMDLEYSDYDCQQDTSVACGPFTVMGEAPKPIWSFLPKSGSCFGNSFDVNISDSIINCIADTITVFEENHNGTTGPGVLTEFCQDEILSQENGEIIEDEFYRTIFQTVNKGLDSLTNQCPFPGQCFFPPDSACIDTIIYDTLQLIIPVHLGGEWQVVQNNQLLPLDNNNVFTIDSTDYLLEVSPTPQTYSATFDVKEITPNGDTIFLSNTLTLDFQWVESWASDTVQHIDSLVILKDSCCTGGAIIEYTHDPVPPAPEYDCPPFSVEFIPALLASSPNVICNDSTYVVTIELSQGIGPYQYIGTSGTLKGNFFVSDTFSIDSIYYEFEFIDSGECDVTVSGEICPCLWGDVTPTYDIATQDDCEGNSTGAIQAVYFTTTYPPFQFSIDGINYQSDPKFSDLPAGLYQYTVKDRFNCTVTNEVLIENDEFFLFNTIFGNTISNLSICEGEEVLLEIDIHNHNDYVIWDNGISTPNQSVSEAGNYIANYHALTQCVIYTDEFQVDVIPNPSIDDIKIPNVFTPDSDGINDSFGPVFKEDVSVNYFNLSIFNRWGQRVFHTTDKNEKWQPDGKISTDVYIYLLEMEIVNCLGEEIYFKDNGDLTLIR